MPSQPSCSARCAWATTVPISGIRIVQSSTNGHYRSDAECPTRPLRRWGYARRMPDYTPMVIAERQSLSDFLGTLEPQQWAAPTWCDKWNVQDLVAHLTAAGNITAPHFFAGFIKTGFKFDAFVEGDLSNYNGGTPADVKARFDQIIQSKRKPPGPAYIALGEIMVHGEDIRRPLGATGEHAPGASRHARRHLQEDRRTAAREAPPRGTEAAGHRHRLVDGRRARGARAVHVAHPRDGRTGAGPRRLRRRRRRDARAPGPDRVPAPNGLDEEAAWRSRAWQTSR